MPAARLDRANWHYRSPRWKHGIGRSALAAVWAQDRRGRHCRRFFPVYELLFTLRRTQGAIGRYEGTTGAAVAAAGRLRRLGRCRRRIPGGGRGLRVWDLWEAYCSRLFLIVLKCLFKDPIVVMLTLLTLITLLRVNVKML